MNATQARTRRSGAKGLTLIEILIALIVMMLGIVGILALFPPALQSSKFAMEDTQAGITGLSVANALTNACRLAVYDPEKHQWQATLSHDLDNGGSVIRYNFVLPKLSESMRHHPGNTEPYKEKDKDDGKFYSDPKKDSEFKLCGDPWVVGTLVKVHNDSDPSDPLNQFAFSFDVEKVNTLAYLEGQPKPYGVGAPYTIEDIDVISKLYQFRIHIFRLTQPFQINDNDTRTEEMTKAKNNSPKTLITTIVTQATTR